MYLFLCAWAAGWFVGQEQERRASPGVSLEACLRTPGSHGGPRTPGCLCQCSSTALRGRGGTRSWRRPIREASRCNYLALPETWMWLCFGDLALIGEAGDVPRGCTDSLPRRGAKARARGRAEGFLRPRGGCPGLVSFLKGGRDEIQCGSLPPPSSLGTTVLTTRPGTTNPTGPAGPDGSFSVRILSGSFSLPGLFMFGETRVACLEEQVSKCAGILEAWASTPAPSRLGLRQALRISLSCAACGCSGPRSRRGYIPLPRAGRGGMLEALLGGRARRLTCPQAPPPGLSPSVGGCIPIELCLVFIRGLDQSCPGRKSRSVVVRPQGS